MEQTQMSKEEFIEFTNKSPEEMVEYFKANGSDLPLDAAKELKGLFERLDNKTITDEDATTLNMLYKTANNIELSDDELEKVAGGWSAWSFVYGTLWGSLSVLASPFTAIYDVGQEIYSEISGNDYSSVTKDIWVDWWDTMKKM